MQRRVSGWDGGEDDARGDDESVPGQEWVEVAETADDLAVHRQADLCGSDRASTFPRTSSYASLRCMGHS